MIPEQVIEEIISKIDIVEYIRSRGVDLNRGNQAICPFDHHEDSDPSFSVKEGEQFFNCFGCYTGGNVLHFIMNYDNVGFVESIKIAADYAGYDLTENDVFTKEDEAKFNERDLLRDIYFDAAQYMNAVMPQDIREHLKNHYGFSDEFIDEDLMGWDDGHLFDHLLSLNKYTEEDLYKTGLFIKLGSQARDFFHTRIVFWYWKRGRPVYAIARETEYTRNLNDYEKFEKDRKYKKMLTHSEKRPYISTQVENKYIYNEDVCLNSRLRPDYVVITEGITDAKLAQQKGIPVISPVTVRYRREDFIKLKKLTEFIPSIYIANDNEENQRGLEGGMDTAEFLTAEGKNVYLTILPKEEGVSKVDLNIFLQGKDKDEFEAFLGNNSERYLDFLVQNGLEAKEDNNEAKMYSFINRALYEASNMDPMRRETFFQRLSDSLDMRITVVRKQYKEVLKEEQAKPEFKETSNYYDDLLEEAKEKSNSEAQKLFKLLVDRGARFFRTSDTDITMALKTGEFYQIHSGECPFAMYLMNNFGWNYLDHKTKKAIFEFKAKAYKHATKMKKQTWLYCKKYDREIYMGISHGNNSILHITPHSIETIYNGSDNGIFVNEPDSIMTDWEFNPEVDKRQAAFGLYETMTKFMPFSEAHSLMLMIAAMCVPLKRFADTTPIIKVHGIAGAGKTQGVKKLCYFFYGNELAIGDMTDASKFDQASVRPIIVFDNLESIKAGALEQFLLYAASGGAREKRDRNSESGTIKQVIDTLAILTAIHPFDKKELLNRSLDIFANKKYHDYSKDMTVVNDEIAENRSQYLSMWVHLLQKCLGATEEIKQKRNEINTELKQHFKDRLNSYYSLMWQMAEEFLGLVGWTKEEVKQLVMEKWIVHQSSIGSRNEKSTSNIYHLLDTLATYIRMGKHRDLDLVLNDVHFSEETGAVTFHATGNQLLNAFTKISKDVGGGKLEYTNSQQLMSRVINELDVLNENNWIVETNVKVVGGTNVHKFYHIINEEFHEGDTDLPKWYK